jgi:hypothetical protein
MSVFLQGGRLLSTLRRAGRCDARHWRGRSNPTSSRSTICVAILAEFSGRSDADAGAATERECQAAGENTSQRNVHVPRQPMSRRFPEFSRLFWRALRPQPGLHLAMRARMAAGGSVR